jgi:aromatic ring-opening dioxygenase catalytic subunit (LigB family)
MRDLLALLVPPDIQPGTPVAAGVERAQAVLAAARPETLVVIDAGWRPRAFAVATAPTIQDEAVLYRGRGAPELARTLIDTAISFGLPAFAEDAPLTPHAASVLQQLWPAPDVPVLSLGVAMAAPSLLQEFGQAIAAAARKVGVHAVAVCVGAIAHDHQAEHDRRANAAVRRFGEQVLERLARSCGEDLFDIDGALWVQAHPETDLCHLAMLLGTTGIDAECEVLGSFSGPGLFTAAVAFYRAQGLPLGGPWEWEATDHPKPL